MLFRTRHGVTPSDKELRELLSLDAKRLGKILKLTNTERERFRLWTIAPCDITPEQLAEQRKEKARAREQQRRRKQGSMPRQIYLAKVAKKVWEVEGISRRTWFRRKRTHYTRSAPTAETGSGTGFVRRAPPP
jgi:hypothetical protein